MSSAATVAPAWAAAHEDTGNHALVWQMKEDKEKFLAGVRKRWAAR
jgi:hypothetical protein